MAFSDKGVWNGTNSKTAESSLQYFYSSSQVVAAGDLVVVCVAVDNTQTTDGVSNTVTGITCSAGNNYVKALEYTNGQGGDANGATIAIFYSKIANTPAVPATDSITVNFSASRDAKAICLHRFNIDTSKDIEVDGTQTNATDAADPPSITATGAQNVEHLWIRASAVETNNSAWTESGTWNVFDTAWTTTGGGGASNMKCGAEWKIATGTSSGASDPTANSADNASIIVGLIEVAPAAPAEVSDPMGTLGFFGV